MQKEEKLALHPDWGVGLGARALLEVGLGLWKEKKPWAMVGAVGNPQVRRIWGVNGTRSGEQSVRTALRGAVSSSFPIPRASFKALSRHLPTEEPA